MAYNNEKRGGEKHGKGRMDRAADGRSLCAGAVSRPQARHAQGRLRKGAAALRLGGIDGCGKACGKGRAAYRLRTRVPRRAGEDLSDRGRRVGQRDRLSAPVRRERTAQPCRARADRRAHEGDGRRAPGTRPRPVGGVDGALRIACPPLPRAARAGRRRHKRARRA